MNLRGLLWPYAKREISVAIPPEEAIERVRSFIVWGSFIWADLHRRESEGQFSGKVTGPRFRMTRVVRCQLVPNINGRVLRDASGNTVVRLRSTQGLAYMLTLSSIGFATYFVSTAQFGPATFCALVLAFLCIVNYIQFWREVDITLEQLRAQLEPQPQPGITDWSGRS
jgi:hypothetical protein